MPVGDEGMLTIALFATTIIQITSEITITGLRHPTTPPPGTPAVRYYPEQAQLKGLTGTAEVLCKVTLEGVLNSCVAVSEEPKGEGFGERAAFIATHLTLRPDQIDPLRQGSGLVEDPKVSLPVRFVLKDN